MSHHPEHILWPLLCPRGSAALCMQETCSPMGAMPFASCLPLMGTSSKPDCRRNLGWKKCYNDLFINPDPAKVGEAAKHCPSCQLPCGETQVLKQTPRPWFRPEVSFQDIITDTKIISCLAPSPSPPVPLTLVKWMCSCVTNQTGGGFGLKQSRQSRKASFNTSISCHLFLTRPHKYFHGIRGKVAPHLSAAELCSIQGFTRLRPCVVKWG